MTKTKQIIRANRCPTCWKPTAKDSCSPGCRQKLIELIEHAIATDCLVSIIYYEESEEPVEVEALQAAELWGIADDVRFARTTERVPIERHLTKRFPVTPSAPRIATRREAELVGRYKHYMAALGIEVETRRMRSARMLLRSDIWVEQRRALIEAKSLVTRGAVRMALAELADYVRFLPEDTNLAVLLPCQPTADLMGYLQTSRYKIEAIWPDGMGGFTDSAYGAFT
jgi:hypothetical protein